MKKLIRYSALLIFAGILLAVLAAGAYRVKKHPGQGGQAGTGTDAGPASAQTGPFDPVKILTPEDFEAAEKKYETVPFQASSLLWKNSAPACDENLARVYLPCTLKTRTQSSSGHALLAEKVLPDLEPSEKDRTILVCRDQWTEDPAGAVSAGHPFRALLVNGNEAMPFEIILTGLPLVCMEKTDDAEITGKEEHSGRILYIPLSAYSGQEEEAEGGYDEEFEEGNYEEGYYEEEEYFCRFHVRGNVSSTFAKKPYKITLTDRAGNKVKGSLADLREDDDWILNPLFTDSTRVRELTAYSLWDRISAFSEVPQASSRMRCVELFLDNSYQGIYGLMEPVDAKQLSLTEGDLLYKIDRWDREYPYLDEYQEKEGESVIYNDGGFPCVEIRYPKRWDRTCSWAPMQAFHTFSIRTRDSATLSEAGAQLDPDSVVSMSLFCAMTHAMDSTWKNSFLIAKKEEEPEEGYRLYRTVWDLNYVFGDVFVYAPEDGYTVFDAGTALTYRPLEDSTYDFEACLEEDPSMEKLLAEKWAVWRRGGISAETVCADAEGYFSMLKNSGALDREMDRWPQQKNCQDALVEMEEWIYARFAYLDTYFNWNTK